MCAVASGSWMIHRAANDYRREARAKLIADAIAAGSMTARHYQLRPARTRRKYVPVGS
jgi:hypothetical protein